MGVVSIFTNYKIACLFGKFKPTFTQGFSSLAYHGHLFRKIWLSTFHSRQVFFSFDLRRVLSGNVCPWPLFTYGIHFMFSISDCIIHFYWAIPINFSIQSFPISKYLQFTNAILVLWVSRPYFRVFINQWSGSAETMFVIACAWESIKYSLQWSIWTSERSLMIRRSLLSSGSSGSVMSNNHLATLFDFYW